MKSILIVISGFIFLAMDSCNKENAKKESPISYEEVDRAVQAVGLKNFEKYSGKLDELLTLEIAAKASGNPASTAATDYQKVMENPTYHNLVYTWDNGRMRKMDLGFTVMELPHSDQISISWVSQTTESDFRNMYREVTQADLDNARAAMDKKLNDGSISAETAELAKGMAEGFMEGEHKREWIDGIADAAVWLENDKSIKVYHKGITFSLFVDVSDENSKNRTVAIEAAKIIVKEKL